MEDHMPAKTGTEECPICGKKLLHVGAHMRQQHHVTMREYRKSGTEGDKAVLTEVNGKRAFTELSGFKILQDGRGHLWIAERIR
jgi:hypothetical protein